MDIETMKAYEWALNQNFGSVAAQYAKKLALYIQSAKSATSEEVQRAIKRFEKRNNKLKEVQDNGDAGCVDIETWEKYQGFIEDNKLAITALRQMRTEPCEWLLSCGYEEFEEHITECGVVFTFIGDEMKNIHYCPNCGRLVTK